MSKLQWLEWLVIGSNWWQEAPQIQAWLEVANVRKTRDSKDSTQIVEFSNICNPKTLVYTALTSRIGTLKNLRGIYLALLVGFQWFPPFPNQAMRDHHPKRHSEVSARYNLVTWSTVIFRGPQFGIAKLVNLVPTTTGLGINQIVTRGNHLVTIILDLLTIVNILDRYT